MKTLNMYATYMLNGLLTVCWLFFFSSTQQPFINLGDESHFTNLHLNFVLSGTGGVQVVLARDKFFIYEDFMKILICLSSCNVMSCSSDTEPTNDKHAGTLKCRT